MEENYNISFRRLENITSLHIKTIEKLNSKFCSIYPYFINVNLGDDVRFLLCDGEYVVDVTEWSGVGLSFSETTPSKEVKDLIHNYLF